MEKLAQVRFSNLEKILYPKLGIKKAQVIEYYIKIAPKMLDARAWTLSAAVSSGLPIRRI
jgi:DNA primase